MATKKSQKKPAPTKAIAKKPRGKKVRGKKAPAKKRGPTKGGPNKSAFIREQPAEMSAKAVVEAGKTAGIELTEGFVYNVRSNAKRAPDKKASIKRGPGRPKAAPRGDESAFRGLVVALGTTRARALVDEVESKLAAIVSGR